MLMLVLCIFFRVWIKLLPILGSISGKTVKLMLFFFFSSRRRHTRLTCDWSSDVCSSDLGCWARGSPDELARQLRWGAARDGSLGQRRREFTGESHDLIPIGELVVARRIRWAALPAADSLEHHPREDAVFREGHGTADRRRHAWVPTGLREKRIEHASRVRLILVAGTRRRAAHREERRRHLVQLVPVCTNEALEITLVATRNHRSADDHAIVVERRKVARQHIGAADPHHVTRGRQDLLHPPGDFRGLPVPRAVDNRNMTWRHDAPRRIGFDSSLAVAMMAPLGVVRRQTVGGVISREHGARRTSPAVTEPTSTRSVTSCCCRPTTSTSAPRRLAKESRDRGTVPRTTTVSTVAPAGIGSVSMRRWKAAAQPFSWTILVISSRFAMATSKSDSMCTKTSLAQPVNNLHASRAAA